MVVMVMVVVMVIVMVMLAPADLVQDVLRDGLGLGHRRLLLHSE